MSINIKEQMTGLLSLPKEIILNLPQVVITGCGEIGIENYKNIIEYTDTKIRINTNIGVLVITGHDLTLKAITAEYITVVGQTSKVEFIR